MSPDTEAKTPQVEHEYIRLWAEAASRVLEQLHGSPLTATLLPASEGPLSEPPPESVWLVWKVSGKLSGEQSFHIALSDAVRLAQLLMQEPLDGKAPLDEGRLDALKELFRQFAGLAATACKSKYGQESSFDLAGNAKPEWESVHQESWVFASPQLAPIQWTACLNANIQTSIATAVAAKASPPPPPPPSVPPVAAQAAKASASSSPPLPIASSKSPAEPGPPAGDVTGNPTNLEMLLDVELEAILRFGQRDMLLRDILELRPGSVIELNRNISEPAELLVGGRVIARGDVVIVDGNYGLRITEIESPHQRLGSIET